MIVIIEDEKSIRDLVLYALKGQGFEAIGYTKSSEFFANLEKDKPELLLLDIMLPEEDGISILQKIRKRNNFKTLPVIMLTAKDSEYDKIMGLDSGADDYVTKPFSMLELVSRIKALLRRAVPKEDNKDCKIYTYEALSMDDDAHCITANGHIIDTTLKEYETLKLLLQKQGKVITRDELLAKVWGYDFDGETRTVDVHIRTLRAKLLSCGEYIITIRGVGYRIGG